MIETIEGDVRYQPFESVIRYIPHCCNDIGVMGSGVAKALYEEWPAVRHRYLAMPNMVLGEMEIIWGSIDTRIANMIGQHKVMVGRDENGIAIGEDGQPPVRYDALRECMNKVANNIVENQEKGNTCEIHTPKFGADLAGGDWEVIEGMISEIWSPLCRVLVCVA